MAGAPTGVDNAATADPDRDGCKNSEDMDDDNDGEADTTDVDDDNDGLIEIATAQQLHNMRYDLAGRSYDDEDDDNGANAGDITGAPTAMTENCKTATSRSVYLCGYELVADIDLSGNDQNGATAGNFDPIRGSFTATLEGNAHAIRNLSITVTTVITDVASTEADAAFLISCEGRISNLLMEDAIIQGRRDAAVLCASMDGASVHNVGIIRNSVRQQDGANLIGITSIVGGLAGNVEDSTISNSYATGDSSSYHLYSHAEAHIGGLVGELHNKSTISNSYASGNVSAFNSQSTNTLVQSGGLVGYLQDSTVSNSYAVGDSSANAANSRSGGLVGHTQNRSVISNSYATGNGNGGNSGGLIGRAATCTVNNSYAVGNTAAPGAGAGGLLGWQSGSNTYSNNYWNSDAAQIASGSARADAAKRGVGSSSSAVTGVTSQTLAQIQALDATTLGWDATNHWSGIGTAGNFPYLRYADNPNTADDSMTTEVNENVDECEFLPGFGNTDTDKVRCGDLLPHQDLYRASGNVVFGEASIGVLSTSQPTFYYSLSGGTLTVTYNLGLRCQHQRKRRRKRGRHRRQRRDLG